VTSIAAIGAPSASVNTSVRRVGSPGSSIAANATGIWSVTGTGQSVPSVKWPLLRSEATSDAPRKPCSGAYAPARSSSRSASSAGLGAQVGASRSNSSGPAQPSIAPL
jgi:hypothetical protein